MPGNRSLFLLATLACATLLSAALFLEHGMGLVPCYLCIVQRFFFLVAGLVALAAVIHNPGPTGVRLYGLATAAASLAGGGFAIRQLWLQSLPADQVPTCGPPADYLFDTLSLAEVLPRLMKGDGNCAEVHWTFLGLSIPGWTLIAFAALAALGLWLALRPRPWR